MGVRNLTSYVREQSNLRESKTFAHRAPGDAAAPDVLVVDGWGFLYAVFLESGIDSVYGGEFGHLASIVVNVCRAWIAVGLVPTFVFDGPYSESKLTTVARRIQEGRVDPINLFYRTSVTGRSTSGFHASVGMLPGLMFPACLDALVGLREEGVECFFADGEADPECAGLAAHYRGYVLALDSDYMIFNAAHKGYIPLDDLVWTQPEPEDSSDEDEDSDGFQTVSRGKKKKVFVKERGIVRGLVPPEDFSSLVVSVYHPETLAASLQIGTGLLPLLATVLGTDFTPPTLPLNFFPKNMPGPERVRRAASVIRTILYPSSSKNPARRRGPKSRLLKAAEGADKVTQLINSVVTDLALHDLGERETAGLTETIRESIFHYIVPDDFPGPGPLSDLELIQPASEDQRRVQRRFLKAYRKGAFASDLMGCFVTGTVWPRISLEDPDVRTSQDVVGAPVRQWTYAILAHGLDGVGREDLAVNAEPPVPDEDELIDVEEEMSDSEEEFEITDMSASVDGVDEKEDMSFDPLVLLRNQLEGLRAQGPQGQHLPSNGDTNSTLGGGLAESVASLTPAELPRPSGPRFVTEYLRRGGRLAPVKVPVRRLEDLVGEHNNALSEVLPTGVINFNLPIQLQPASTRLSLLLHALHSNTPQIRELPAQWTALAISLRWTLIAAATRLPLSNGKGVYRGKWTASEAKAFIASCASPKPLPADASDRSREEEDEIPARIVLNPADLSTRSVQLTSQILAGIEATLLLSQALLLKTEVFTVNQATRCVSGTKFHAAISSLSASRQAFENGLQDADQAHGDEELRQAVFNAAIGELREAGYLAEENWERAARIKKSKAVPSHAAPSNSAKKGAKSGPGPKSKGMFDILAALGTEA